MKEVHCDVIRDLLPLYEDGAASEETQALVRRHLADCPGCREELRKLRVPVSLPPEGDREMWEKFTAHREKLRRKKRNILIVIGAVLAMIAAFCLWYTRPRSFPAMGEGDRIGNVSINVMESVLRENGKADMEGWALDSYDGRDHVPGELEAILKSCRYRVSLRSLFPFPNPDTVRGDKDAATIIISAVSEDGSGFTAWYKGGTVTLSVGGKTIVAHAEDGEIGAKLLGYVKEFGWT